MVVSFLDLQLTCIISLFLKMVIIGHCLLWLELFGSEEGWFPSWEPSLGNQFSSVAQSCPTLCDPMNRSMPGLHHQLPEFIQPSHPLLSPSPPAPNPSGLWIKNSQDLGVKGRWGWRYRRKRKTGRKVSWGDADIRFHGIKISIWALYLGTPFFRLFHYYLPLPTP